MTAMRSFEHGSIGTSSFIFVVTVTLSLVICGVATAQEEKPNILVIFGDDIGITNISAYSEGLCPFIPRPVSSIIGWRPSVSTKSTTGIRLPAASPLGNAARLAPPQATAHEDACHAGHQRVVVRLPSSSSSVAVIIGVSASPGR
jgi:hypothetical protein